MEKIEQIEQEYPSYQINSFEELSNVVTEENCDMIIGNLYGMMRQFIKLKQKYPF